MKVHQDSTISGQKKICIKEGEPLEGLSYRAESKKALNFALMLLIRFRENMQLRVFRYRTTVYRYCLVTSVVALQ